MNNTKDKKKKKVVLKGRRKAPNGITMLPEDGQQAVNQMKIPGQSAVAPIQDPNLPQFPQSPTSNPNDIQAQSTLDMRPMNQIGQPIQPNASPERQGSRMGNWLRNQSISTNNVVAGGVQALNAFVPYQQPRDNNQKLVNAYNPYPQGTGSQATFEKGGKVEKNKAIHEKMFAKTNAKFGKKVKLKMTFDDGGKLNWDSWNQFHQFASQQPGYGTDSLNHENYNNEVLTRYNQQFPEQAINPNDIIKYQQAATTDTDVQKSFGTSPIDNKLGRQTSGYQHREAVYNHLDPYGKQIEHKNFGTNTQGAEQFIQNKKKIQSLPTELPQSNTTNNSDYNPGLENSNMRDTSFPTLAQAKNKAKNKGQDPSNFYMAEGGFIPQGENGLYTENNQVRKIGSNPFTGDTVKFKGPSHSEGGIDINYANQPVEVEGDETGFIDRSGAMNVMGNLTVPGSKMKFKKATELIAKEETKVNKMGEKGSKLILNSDPKNKFQNPSFNTGAVLQDAHMQRMKELSDSKEFLATTQNRILDLSEATGIEAKDIAKDFKGNISKGMAKFGKRIAINGSQSDPNVLAEQQELMKKPWYNKAIKEWQDPRHNRKPLGNMNKFDDGLKGDRTEWVKHYNDRNSDKDLRSGSSNVTGVSGPMSNESDAPFNALPTSGYQNMEYKPVGPNTEEGNFYSNQDTPKPMNIGELPNPVKTKNLEDDGSEKTTTTKRKSFLRDKLGFSDLLPEFTELFDQVEPVTGQQTQPQLYSDYQVSMQDQIEQNQGDFNAVEKTLSHNPSALGALSAQKYNADNQVRGNEFRTNQGIKNDITNKNTSLINQFKDTNARLDDEKMVRQAQARENTRANRFGAMTSISDKIAQQRRDNRTMSIEEGIYHYHLDANGHPVYDGGPMTLTPPSIGQTNVQQRTKIQNKTNPYDPEEDTKIETTYAMGGSMSGHSSGHFSGGMMAYRGVGNSDDYSYKKKKKKKSINSF